MKHISIAFLAIALSALVVYSRWITFYMAGQIQADWFSITSLILIPLVEILRVVPWVLAGYFLRGKGIYVVIAVSVVAHPLFKHILLMDLDFDAARDFSAGVAVTVISAVSFLAGAWIRSEKRL
ncbi:MAG: hypothetical protein P1U67_09465 [Alcanivoracaceae bacterium]|nr:hypothetical protein [Alcanivoracaceae bacterium]